MSDLLVRKTGRAGRITLNRPGALNALTWEMCLGIEDALDVWADDDEVALVIVDAAGEKAFCAGGDIAEMYRRGRAGDLDYGRRFWRDEYRLNAKIAEYPKPYVALMQGFTMGGGVGVACHGSHRIVGETSRIAMPECGIGLIPDVGGTMLLSRAPGRLGEFLGTTGHRMDAGDAILASFADSFVPEADWPALVADLETSGDAGLVAAAARPAPPAKLSIACAYEAISRVRGTSGIRRALEMEYRFTWRAVAESDFLEGIRATIIDKDRSPNWRHSSPEDVTPGEVARMLMPLGADRLTFERESD
jgi:enoyl-CoA hydratase